MKRIILCGAVLHACSANAQQSPMEHVLVSVPLHKKQAETALPVTVLSGDELSRQAASTLGETLSGKPGLASASFGPGVGRPIIRGQQGPRALMLQNGTLSADVSSLSPDHAVSVEALLAESIEVLRGPATLLYGGGAIGGVVNVIDNRIPRAPIEGLSGAVEYRYDDAADLHGRVFRLEGGSGPLAFHLSGSIRDADDLDVPGLAIDEEALEQSESLLNGGADEDHDDHDEDHEEEFGNTDGFIANTDNESDTFNAGFSYQFGDKGFAGLSVSHLDTNYGIPPGAHEHGHEEDEHDDDGHDEEEEGEEEELIRIDLEQTRADALLHIHEPVAGIEVLRAFTTYTDYQHKELEGAETGTEFDRQTWEHRLEVVHDPILGAHGVLGLQWRTDSFEAIGEEAYVPQTDSEEIGLFLIEDFHHGDWIFETGIRGDWVKRDPDLNSTGSETFTSWSFSGSALWQLSDQWRAGLALSRAQRAPSTEELYSNAEAAIPVTHAATGIIEIGDTSFTEESSLNADFTLGWSNALSWAELSFFHNTFEDYIFLLNTGTFVEETPVYRYAQDDATFYGVEFDSEFQLAESGGARLLLGLNGDIVRADIDDNGDIPRLPPMRLGASLTVQTDSYSVWGKMRNAQEQDRPGDFETATDGYTRWDLGADYRWALANDTELMLFAKWKNIGDEEIRLSTSFLRNVAPEAGESFELGLRYSF